jgi:uncharacterized membrane protein/heat shock protein HslJ
MLRINIQILVAVIMIAVSCTPHQKAAQQTGNTAKNKISSSGILPCDDCEIDFKAQGIDPSWSLKMDFEGSFTFTNPEGNVIKVSALESVNTQDSSVSTYNVNTEMTQLVITLTNEESVDKTSNQKYPYKVKVRIKNKKDKEYKDYEGFGDFQVDLRLHNIWAIQKVNGKDLIPSVYTKGIPVIELFVAEKRISGHDGCNQINGSFTTSGNTISFGTLISTLMACPKENLDFGSLVYEKTYQFQFGNNCLVLMQKGKEIMVLKNVD